MAQSYPNLIKAEQMVSPEILARYNVETMSGHNGQLRQVRLDDSDNVKRFDRAIGAQMAQLDSQKSGSGIGHWWRYWTDAAYYKAHKNGQISPEDKALAEKTAILRAARGEIKA